MLTIILMIIVVIIIKIIMILIMMMTVAKPGTDGDNLCLMIRSKPV